MASRILVMDDDDSILELYRLLLEGEAGYEVTLSLIAIEEVSSIAEMQPDLIILDAKLGSHNEGLLLLQKLKMYRPTQTIPILLCSAAEDLLRQHEETICARGVAILHKPFDIDELLHLVQQLLGEKEQQRGSRS